MRLLSKATLLGAFFVIVASRASASPVVNVIDGVCGQPVHLERFGELASWQTKHPLAEITPFAIESDDNLTWLYVSSGNNQLNIGPSEFGAFKLKLKETLLAINPGMEFIDGRTELTATYEGDAFISGNNQPATHGFRVTLVGGCAFETVVTKAGYGHRSEVLALLDLIQVVL